MSYNSCYAGVNRGGHAAGHIISLAGQVKFPEWFKTPPFDVQHAEMFFGALDSELQLHQVSSEEERYSILVSLLDLRLLEEEAAAMVRQRPLTQPYSLLKQAVLEPIRGMDQNKRLRVLLQNERLRDDERPSQLRTRLAAIAQPFGAAANFQQVLRDAWLAALPAEWRPALQQVDDGLEAGMKADVFSAWRDDPASRHLYQAAIATPEQQPPEENSDALPVIGARLAQLEEMVSQLSLQLSQLQGCNQTPSAGATNGAQLEKIKTIQVKNIQLNIAEDLSEPSKFCCKFQLLSELFAFIKGTDSLVLLGIERETQTTVTLTEVDQMFGHIVVRGNTQSAVANACRKIVQIAERQRISMPMPTHFLSIPIASESFQRAYAQLKKNWARHLDVNLLQSHSKWQIIVGKLMLLNEQEVAAAAQIVEEFVHQEMRERYPQLALEVRGLASVEEDASQARTVYGKIVEDSSYKEMQKLSDELLVRLDGAGFLVLEEHSCPAEMDAGLFLTVASSSLAIERAAANGECEEENWKRRDYFDATNIVQKLSQFYFGKLLIESLSICEMGTDTEEHGYKTVSQHFLDLRKANPAYLRAGKSQQSGLNTPD